MKKKIFFNFIITHYLRDFEWSWIWQYFDYILNYILLKAFSLLEFQTTRKIYNHIERTGDYEKVESTRFFGHMVYYFTVSKKIDRLLMHLIKKQL